MQLNLFDENIQYVNEEAAVGECFNKINERLATTNFMLSHLEVDGILVYEDHYDYILENLATIETIIVRVTTYKKLLDETVLDLSDYLTKAISETKLLSDDFYKGPNKETWTKLSQLLEGLQWVVQAIQPLHTLHNNEMPYLNSLTYSVISSALSDKFEEFEEALKQSDLILVADLLKYEIAESLLKLSLEIDITIDNEVVRNDLN